MEVELLDRLSADALILRVRWRSTSMGNDETATVCVSLNSDEVTEEAFDSEDGAPIKLSKRIRALAIAQADHVAQRLSGLYRELPIG